MNKAHNCRYHRWLRLAGLAAMAATLGLGGCLHRGVVRIASDNRSDRIDQVVIHFTGLPFAQSLATLTAADQRVSAHYLLPESGDPSYSRSALRVHQLVDEADRAWHAGASRWGAVGQLNASSIGIELVNQGRCEPAPAAAADAGPEALECRFRPFDPDQVAMLADLLNDILERYPRIDPVDIVGHADIAPDRRSDPGPLFPWQALHDRGIGPWYEAASVARFAAEFAREPPGLARLQAALAAWGYPVAVSGELDTQTRYVLRAFQMHFRPADYAGQPDIETAAIVFALLERYRPAALERLPR